MTDGGESGIDPDEVRAQMQAAIERVRRQFGETVKAQEQSQEKPEAKQVEKSEGSPANKG